MALSAARGLCTGLSRQPVLCWSQRTHICAAFRATPRFTHYSTSTSRQPVVMAAAAAAAGNAPAAPKYWLLSYQYVPDILEKRGPYREQHLAGAKSHLDAGRLVAAGAVGDPVEGATFFFKNISKEEIEAFVAADPYVVNGLVPSWSIKPFAVVVGSP